MRFCADNLNATTMRLMVGDVSPPRYAVTVNYQTEPLVPPVKARRLTGKAYRIARRRYARERRAWVRSGSPMIHRRILIPSAQVSAGDDAKPPHGRHCPT